MDVARCSRSPFIYRTILWLDVVLSEIMPRSAGNTVSNEHMDLIHLCLILFNLTCSTEFKCPFSPLAALRIIIEVKLGLGRTFTFGRIVLLDTV